MKLVKRGKYYYLDVTIDGRRLRPSTGCTEEAEALKMAPAMLTDLLEGAASEAEGMLSLKEGFQKLFNEEWRHSKDRPGVQARIKEIERLVGPETMLDRIDRTTLIRLQAALAEKTGKGGRPATPATVNRKMAVIIRLLNTAHVDWQLIPAPPRIKPMKVPESLVRALTDTEVDALLANSKQAYRRVWRFLIETGVRMGEFLALEWHHFDLERGILRVWEADDMATKRGKAKVLPLTPSMVAWLKKRKQEAVRPFTGISRWMIRDEWNRIKKQMGLEKDRGFVPHSLRHTCATRLIRQGVPTSTVQKWLGHSNISTTTKYLDQSVEDMAAHVTAVEVKPKAQLRAVK